jgi:hypothetical protein
MVPLLVVLGVMYLLMLIIYMWIKHFRACLKITLILLIPPAILLMLAQLPPQDKNKSLLPRGPVLHSQ